MKRKNAKPHKLLRIITRLSGNVYRRDVDLSRLFLLRITEGDAINRRLY